MTNYCFILLNLFVFCLNNRDVKANNLVNIVGQRVNFTGNATTNQLNIISDDDITSITFNDTISDENVDAQISQFNITTDTSELQRIEVTSESVEQIILDGSVADNVDENKSSVDVIELENSKSGSAVNAIIIESVFDNRTLDVKVSNLDEHVEQSGVAVASDIEIWISSGKILDFQDVKNMTNKSIEIDGNSAGVEKVWTGSSSSMNESVAYLMKIDEKIDEDELAKNPDTNGDMNYTIGNSLKSPELKNQHVDALKTDKENKHIDESTTAIIDYDVLFAGIFDVNSNKESATEGTTANAGGSDDNHVLSQIINQSGAINGADDDSGVLENSKYQNSATIESLNGFGSNANNLKNMAFDQVGGAGRRRGRGGGRGGGGNRRAFENVMQSQANNFDNGQYFSVDNNNGIGNIGAGGRRGNHGNMPGNPEIGGFGPGIGRGGGRGGGGGGGRGLANSGGASNIDQFSGANDNGFAAGRREMGANHFNEGQNYGFGSDGTTWGINSEIGGPNAGRNNVGRRAGHGGGGRRQGFEDIAGAHPRNGNNGQSIGIGWNDGGGGGGMGRRGARLGMNNNLGPLVAANSGRQVGEEAVITKSIQTPEFSENLGAASGIDDGFGLGAGQRGAHGNGRFPGRRGMGAQITPSPEQGFDNFGNALNLRNRQRHRKLNPPERTMTWKPKKRPKGRPPPPPGFSGYRPEGWGKGGHAYNERGEKVRRRSQLKHEQYMKEIFGEEDYNDNDILLPEDLNGREIAAPGQYPHATAIGVQTGLESKSIDWKCGGSLISRSFVLTAAHCTNFGGEPPTHVKIGDIYLKYRDRNSTKPQTIEIQQIVIHPSYLESSYYYDIALVKLSRPVDFSRFARPARLWSSEDMPYETVFAIGYGATQFGKAATNVLTGLNFTLIGNQECNTTLPSLPETEYGIVDSQVCALDRMGTKDTCQGDSGGPLQLNLPGRRRTRYSLVGITSYGLFCGGRTPSVYTRIFTFLDWIENIVWPLEPIPIA